MNRHSHNPNLLLHTDNHYGVYPVQCTAGPLIKEYLERLDCVIQRALAEHPRTFAFRIDLRFPQDYSGPGLEGNEGITRFFESFKAKIQANRNRASRTLQLAHDSSVRFLWCREYSCQEQRPHYHAVIFLNHDAFCSLGQFQQGHDNLFNRLHEAWASALALPVAQMAGLVEFPSQSTWLLQSHDRATLADFFSRTSYLAKAHTKHYFAGVHNLGSSRR